MKKLLASISISAVIVMIGFSINMVSYGNVGAQDPDSQTSEEDQSNETTETTAENYEYVAQPGDSYIQMTRKAVQTYGIETDGHIGAAGILFAETNLASLAGWPALNEGQTVSISRASVEEWFKKAAELSVEEKASWELYVPFVDFNTNSIGE